MSGPVVVVDGVWKKFRRGERHDSLRDLIPSLTKKLLGRVRSRELDNADEFWAVKDLSFELNRGEAFGIIGPNGAGKSTTLKLLTRILRPTRGTCTLTGRVGALIEVAAGFHPDLTGRENIFLQGAVMGMKRAEIATKLDEIIEFAGVADFVDTQVKRYSSGMNARLGFSIAAHLDPDVLVIDEVLSVGDMAFQQRCIERMERFKKDGLTIIFVSHNLQAIATLCDRAIHLERSCKAIGPTSEVLESYVTTTRKSHAADETADVVIERAELVGASAPVIVSPGAKLTLRVSYRSRQPLSDLTFGFILYRSTDNLVVYDGNIRGTDIGVESMPAGGSATIDFHFSPHLTRGQYHVECHVFHNPTQRFLCRPLPAAALTVRETTTYAGIADIELSAAAVKATEVECC